MISRLSPQTEVEAMTGHHTSEWDITGFYLKMTFYLHSDVDMSSSPRQCDVRKHMILNCVSAFSTDRRRSGRLPSDCDDQVTLLLGRTTGPCRRFLWKRSSYPGPKCVWKPLLARMLFYSVSKCFAILHELTDWYHLDTIQKLELFSHHTFSPAGFKPSKISLRIHSVQACYNLTHHTASFKTASMLPTLECVPTEHATQKLHGLRTFADASISDFSNWFTSLNIRGEIRYRQVITKISPRDNYHSIH